MIAENSHHFNYRSILEISDRINWRIEDIIGGNKYLNFAKPFLPEALAGVNSILCTNSGKLKLNQIRGNSYLHLFNQFSVPETPKYTTLLISFSRSDSQNQSCLKTV